MGEQKFLNGRVTLLGGDCLEVLKTLADDSVDSVVCDPPYGIDFMGKEWDSFGRSREYEAREGYGDKGILPGYGRGGTSEQRESYRRKSNLAFQEWAEAWARELLRVLKPGGHVLAFSGTRTYHRMACAIEDAGFEIRDQIGWAYGSGFPKSHDVSKGIDKAGGLSPRDQSALLRKRREAADLTREQVAEAVGCTPSSVRDWEEGRARAVGRSIEWIIPSDNYRSKVADLLGYSTDERELIGVAADRRDDGTVIGLGHSGTLRGGGQTDAAKQWQGWGTALKPAWEPICVARKPLIGTVAENVLTHGTGALNIGECRVAHVVADTAFTSLAPCHGNRLGDADTAAARRGTQGEAKEYVGRWPANIIHDGSDEVLAAFPETAPSTQGKPRGAAAGDGWGMTMTGAEYSDSGSAARFFYTAKADAEDRLGSKHPTVKPLDLMQYLVRLVTPKGGTVLDPFAGTGTTGEAAWREGMNAILIEREAEYQADIARRMDLAAKPTKRAAVAKTKNKLDDPNSLPLFAEPAE